jgi:hypothetical protein
MLHSPIGVSMAFAREKHLPWRNGFKTTSGKQRGPLWTALTALQSAQSSESSKVDTALQGRVHPL